MTAAEWMARLGGLAAAIAALELLAVRRAYADDGVFAWPVLRRELPPRLRPFVDPLFGYRGTLAIAAAQLGAAAALAVTADPAPAWIAFAAVLLVAIRWRGSYNGGSDAMLLVVLLVVALARTAPGSELAAGAVAYGAAQLVLSYFIAGASKLRDPAWRAGRALPILVALPHYRVPPAAARVLAHPIGTRALAWGMLLFELGAPLALVDARACVAVLAIAFAFHVANAVAFGLDRFLWTWLAAFPALVAQHGWLAPG